MKLEEKINKYLDESPLNEKGPVGGENDGALKFVFKLPKSGTMTAEFLDGTKTEVNVDPDDKSAGKYAFVTKNGRVMETWSKKPSKEAAHQRLKELKFFG